MEENAKKLTLQDIAQAFDTSIENLQKLIETDSVTLPLEKKAISPDETAAILGISPQLLNKYIEEDKIKILQIGDTQRISINEIKRFKAVIRNLRLQEISKILKITVYDLISILKEKKEIAYVHDDNKKEKIAQESLFKSLTNTKQEIEKNSFTIKETAGILNLSQQVVRTLIREGHLKIIPTFGKRYEILKEGIEKYKKHIASLKKFEGNSLSVKEAAPILNLSQCTVWSLIKKGKLKAHRVGKHYRFFKNDIEEYKQYLISLKKTEQKKQESMPGYESKYKELLSIQEASLILNLSNGKVWSLIKEGKIKSLRISRFYRIAKEEIERYKIYLNSLISVQDAAKLLKISIITLYKEMKKKQIRGEVRKARVLYLSEKDFEMLTTRSS